MQKVIKLPVKVQKDLFLFVGGFPRFIYDINLRSCILKRLTYKIQCEALSSKNVPSEQETR